MKSLTRIFLSLGLLATVACSTLPRSGSISSTVFGTVDLPGDMVPPDGSVLLVSLVEIESDSILAQERILNMREEPIAFSLRYDPNLVYEGGRFGISAAFYIGGRLAYNNDPMDTRVTSDGFKQSIEIALRRAD